MSRTRFRAPADTALPSEFPSVGIVHTSFLALESLTGLFGEIGPDVVLRHVVDGGLLASVIAQGGVTPELRDRLLGRFRAAAAAGCDVVFSQCSSVGEVADEAARTLSVPVVKIDSAMAERACTLGSRIGVIATLATTLGPTCRLLTAAAHVQGVRVELVPELVPDAFALLERGEREAHDELVIAAVRALSQRSDVVVCAQGSTAAIVPRLGETRAPVLTSPRLGVERAVSLARREAARRNALA
jgi:aspartate/glutamate racemase